MTKQAPSELYLLDVVADDPRFEGFALEDSPSILGNETLDNDIRAGFKEARNNPDWVQPLLAENWTPPKVTGRVSSFNDYPGLDMLFPAFSHRAIAELRDLLEPNGELLPLNSNVGGEYYFYNITTVSDALDRQHSDCKFRSDPPTTTTSIQYFAFHEDNLNGLVIFRLREWPIGIIVSDEFVRRVDESGLQGFSFVKIWPYRPGQNWRVEGRRKIVSNQVAIDPKKETFVLMLSLEGETPNAEENTVIARLGNELDSQLLIQEPGETYYGSYEGSDIAQGEFRFFITTPDVDQLEKKLIPWLSALGWPHHVRTIKRAGRLHQVDAIETIQDLR